MDAPTGTFLAVPPDVRRHAVAAEAGTEVLALGGPGAFEPAASEWIEQARPHMRDRPERARAILDDLRRERPDSPGLRFGEALLAPPRATRPALASGSPRRSSASRSCAVRRRASRCSHRCSCETS